METSCNSRNSPNNINYWCIAMAVNPNATIDFISLFFSSFVTLNSCLVQMSEYHTFLAHLGNSAPTSFDLPVWTHVVLWWTIELLCLLRCFSLICCISVENFNLQLQVSNLPDEASRFWHSDCFLVQRVEKAIK